MAWLDSARLGCLSEMLIAVEGGDVGGGGGGVDGAAEC